MFEPRIKISRELYDRVKQHAEAAGYSSVEEFVQHALEQALASADTPDTDQKLIEKQLKGLGPLE